MPVGRVREDDELATELLFIFSHQAQALLDVGNVILALEVVEVVTQHHDHVKIFGNLQLSGFFVGAVAINRQVLIVGKRQFVFTEIFQGILKGIFTLITARDIENLYPLGVCVVQKLQRSGCGNRAIVSNPFVPRAVIKKLFSRVDHVTPVAVAAQNGVIDIADDSQRAIPLLVSLECSIELHPRYIEALIVKRFELGSRLLPGDCGSQ